MNLSGYVGHVTTFSSVFTIVCCIVVGLGLGLDLVSGCLVNVMHTYLCYFRLSLSHCQGGSGGGGRNFRVKLFTSQTKFHESRRKRLHIETAAGVLTGRRTRADGRAIFIRYIYSTKIGTRHINK